MTVLGRKEALAKLQEEAGDIERLFEKPSTQWRLALRRFRGRRSGMIGLGIVTTLVLIAILAPLIAPYDPTDVLIGEEDVSRYESPCIHLFWLP